jgi:hypothetical protein
MAHPLGIELVFVEIGYLYCARTELPLAMLTISIWQADQFRTIHVDLLHVITMLSNAQLNGIDVILKIMKAKMDLASLKLPVLLLSV